MRPGTKSRWKRVGVGALVLLVSLILSLALVEIGVRIFVEPVPAAAAPIFEADSQYVFRLRPGAVLRRSETAPDGKVVVFYDKISTQGLRDDYIAKKEAGEFRIVMLGDSFTLGGNTSREETTSGQLQRLIEKKYPQQKIRVINLGVSGTGPWQQRARLNEIGFGLEPDVVVHQLFLANDIGNTLTTTGEHLEACIPEWEYSMLLWRMHNYRRIRAEYWLHLHSRTYGQLRATIGRKRLIDFFCRDLPFVSPIDPPVAPKSAPRLDQIEVDLAVWYPELERGWSRMMDDLGGTAADCAQRKIRYVVYNIPSYPMLSDEEWSVQTQTRQSSKYERGKAERLTLEDLKRRGIDSFSVFDALGAGVEPDEVFHAKQGHLGPVGNKIVAEQILSYVERAGWLETDKGFTEGNEENEGSSRN